MKHRFNGMKNYLNELDSSFVSSVVYLGAAITLIAVDDLIIEVLGVPSLLIKTMVGLSGGVSFVMAWHYLQHTVLIQGEQQFLPVAYLTYCLLAFVLGCLIIPLQWVVILFAVALGVSILMRR